MIKLINPHDVSVLRDLLQNIGQTSGRILFEIESEVPLSKKGERKKVYIASPNICPTKHVPHYIQTSILDSMLNNNDM